MTSTLRRVLVGCALAAVFALILPYLGIDVFSPMSSFFGLSSSDEALQDLDSLREPSATDSQEVSEIHRLLGREEE